jgi:hypothetical protein
MGIIREEQGRKQRAVHVIEAYWLSILKVRAAKGELQRRKLKKKQKIAATIIQRYGSFICQAIVVILIDARIHITFFHYPEISKASL